MTGIVDIDADQGALCVIVIIDAAGERSEQGRFLNIGPAMVPSITHPAACARTVATLLKP
jgi:hypothetical protein